MRLLPSLNEWFLVTRSRSMAAGTLHHVINIAVPPFLHTGIEFFAAECLVDLSDAAFERVVLLVAEERTASELIPQRLDSFHGILIGGMELVFLGGFCQTQTLVVVVVKGVEGVSVVHHYVEQCLVFVIWFYLLVLNGAAYHLHQLAQFCYLLAVYALVDGIALDEILLQNLVGPLTELDTSFGVHTISHRNNHIEVEIWDGTGHLPASLHLNLCNFCTG